MSSQMFARHFNIVSEFGDGTVDVPRTAWTPEASQGQPRQSARPTTAGRVSFASLSRPGSLGAFVQARVLGPTLAGSLQMQVRTATDAELVAVRPKNAPSFDLAANVLQQTVELTTQFGRPVQVGPTDALAFVTSETARGGVEFLVYEFDSSAGLQALQTAFACCDGDESAEFKVIEVTEDTVLPSFEGTLYVFANAPVDAPALITFPPAADNVAPSKIVVTRILGSGYVGVRGNPLNGQTNGGVVLNGLEAVTFTRVGDGYVGAKPLLRGAVTVTNAVLGGTQPLPLPDSPDASAILNYSASGDLVVPSLAGWPRGAAYTLERDPANEAQVRVTLAVGTDTLNGVVNGAGYLSPRSSAILVRTDAGLVMVDSGNADPGLFEEVGGNAAIQAWGRKLKVVNLSGAGAQTLTLPARSLVPMGAPLVVTNAVNVAKTVATAGADQFVGGGVAPATTFVVPARSSITIYASTTAAPGAWAVVS